MTAFPAFFALPVEWKKISAKGRMHMKTDAKLHIREYGGILAEPEKKHCCGWRVVCPDG